MRYIEGFAREQTTLFPEVLDDYITDDNPVRFIDTYVDSLNLIEFGFTYALTNDIGRKPYNPADLLKLYIYGYLNRIRSSRRLEKETHRNIELTWLLHKLHPDFKTIADFRKNNLKAIKKVCRNFTFLCKGLDLFGCELIAVDGSKFSAVNSNRRSFTNKKIKSILKKINEEIDSYLRTLDQKDEEEKDIKNPTKDELEQKIKELKERKNKYEELQKQLEQSGETQVSLTDPDSRMMTTSSKGIDVCYNMQIVTDSKHKLIVDHDITNECNDHNQMANMSKKAKEILDVEKIESLGDKGYYDREQVKECHDNNIECYIPKQTKSNNKKLGLYVYKDFQYDRENDCYICPAEQKLTFRGQWNKSGQETRVYQAHSCNKCPQKFKCTRAKYNRRIYRWVHEDIMEKMEQRVQKNKEKVKLRKAIVEHPFGTMKYNMGFSHFLVKGFAKVRGEAALMVLAYNMKRVLNILNAKELIQAVA